MTLNNSQKQIRARALPASARRDYIARKVLMFAALLMATYAALIPIMNRLFE